MCFSSILWLMVIDCLSVFLFGFEYPSVFVGEKFLFCLPPFLSCIPPFLHFSFHIFLILCTLFSTCLHQVSVCPHIRRGTLLMLYYRGRSGFVKFLPFPFLSRWRAGKVGICVRSPTLPFFAKLGWNGISCGTMCVFADE